MEFDLIHRYFKTPFGKLAQANPGTVLCGIGDDCASLALSPAHHMFTSTDTLVEGVHFFSDSSPRHVGWKSLACNLSDLAACGASPIGFTLNLSLPDVNESWLTGFSTGLLEVATRFNCPLVGGDTTSAGSSSLKTLSITVFGQAPATHRGFNRAHAMPGEDIWVSGTPGLARLGLLLEYQRRGRLAQCSRGIQLKHVQGLLAALPEHLARQAIERLEMPTPRIELGLQLRGVAGACLDLSDGLSGDLAHIANASNTAALLFEASLESMWRILWPEVDHCPDPARLLKTLLAETLLGGDDFELCWTAHPKYREVIQSLSPNLYRVGAVESGNGVWLRASGKEQRTRISGLSYNHFSEGKN